MGEKILSWFEKIATGEKRRLFFAIIIESPKKKLPTETQGG